VATADHDHVEFLGVEHLDTLSLTTADAPLGKQKSPPGVYPAGRVQ